MNVLPRSPAGDSKRALGLETDCLFGVGARRHNVGNLLGATLRILILPFGGSNPPPQPRISRVQRLSSVLREAQTNQCLARAGRVLRLTRGVLKRFLGQFWGPVSDRRFPISGIFPAPLLRPVRNERRLGSHIGDHEEVWGHAASA